VKFEAIIMGSKFSSLAAHAHVTFALIFLILSKSHNVSFSEKTKKTPKGVTAEDEGRPTRAFLNKVWHQLPELKVASEGENVIF